LTEEILMKPPNAPTRDEESSQVRTRKAYQKPQLQVYGDLAEITKSILGSKTADGSGHPNKHFTS
jgi:hypothetical protein